MNAGSEVQGGSWLLNGRPIDVYTTVKALCLAERSCSGPDKLCHELDSLWGSSHCGQWRGHWLNGKHAQPCHYEHVEIKLRHSVLERDCEEA